MNRIFLREAGAENGRNGGRSRGKKRGKDIERMVADQFNIAVTGLTRSAGVTFAASALALYCAESGKTVQFTQCLNPSSPAAGPLLFDAAAMDRRFANRQFHDVYRLIREGRPLRGIKNLELGVNWVLPVPENRTWTSSLNIAEKARLIQNARGEICIFDFQSGDGWDEFLMDMDLVIVIVDPLPSKLIEGAERFKMLKKMEMGSGGIQAGMRTDAERWNCADTAGRQAEDSSAATGTASVSSVEPSAGTASRQTILTAGSPPPVQWMVNRSSSGVNRRQVAGYLKNNDLMWIKNFPAEEIYGDEYACRFHWENQEIKCHLLDIFTKISHDYLII